MSKRGDKKRKRIREARRVKRMPYDAVQLGPLTIERYGRSMRTAVDQSSPELEKFRDAGRKFFERLPAEYEAGIARLQETLAPHDAFDILAWLWMANSLMNPETYKEWEHEGLAAAVELAAAVLLRRPTRAGSSAPAPNQPDYEAIQGHLRELLQTNALCRMHEAVGVPGQPDPFAEMRAAAIGHRVAVRAPSYDWQETNTVQELFDDQAVSGDVLAACDFTATTGLALVNAVNEFGLERLKQRTLQARAYADQLIAKLDDDESLREGPEGETLAALKAMGVPESERRIHEIMLAWAAHEVGQTLSFTASELAERTGVNRGEVDAYLSAFSIEFGEELPHGKDIDVEDVRARPLACDGQGRYLCVSAPSLIWALRPCIEKALKDHDERAFKRFERHRRAMVERRANVALTSALRPDWAHGEVRYDGDGSDQHGEIDGLVRMDTAVLIIEAKASSMRPSARRLAQDSFRDWLKNEVSKAAEQTRRSRDLLLGAPADLRITDKRGHPLKLDLNGVEHTFELIVVLEDLSGVAPSTWHLADAGLLPSDPTPLLISLHDLELICEIVERPSELIHYLKCRRRLDRTRAAWAPDELDYFMHYLMFGLFWEDAPDGTSPAPTHLLSHTEQLDSWFFYKHGLRKTAAKRPSVNHHRDVRELLDCFDQSRATGRLDPALAILDFDEKTRRRIASALTRHKRRSALDSRTHDETIISPQHAVTVMTVPAARSQELADRLRKYGTLKKHQMKLDRWVGFGGWAGPPEPIQLAVSLTEPWVPNTELDTLVSSLPSAGKTGDFDGRAEARRRQRQARKIRREDTPNG